MEPSIFHPADPISLGLFLLLVAMMVGVVVNASHVPVRSQFYRVIVFLGAWITVFTGYVGTGFPAANLIPGLPIFFGALLLGAVIVGFGKTTNVFLRYPTWTLVAFQGFRWPLELILHHWAKTGVIPMTMTWSGQNFDIFTGVLALLVLIDKLRVPAYYWFFNVVGIALLLNVLRVVVMSSGLPFSWNVQPTFQLAVQFPYAMIAYILVFFAICGHILLTRKLIQERAASQVA